MNIQKLGTLRQFEILLKVYDMGSVSKAAEALHLSQPTLSMQLKKLGSQADVRLYDQVGKKLIFTDAGLTVVAAARSIIRELQNLSESLAQLHGLTQGVLKLAVVTSAKYFIPHLLGPFCQRYPDIDVQLKVGNRAQVIERMTKAEDDFYVFSQLPSINNASVIEFLPNPLVLITAPNHPLVVQTKVTLDDLKQHKFIMREMGSGTRLTIENYLSFAGIELPVQMTIESNEAIKHCVMEDLGISILSAHALSFGGDEGVVRVPVEGFPIESNWSFVWPNEKALSPIADVFLKYIQTDGKQSLEQILQR